MAREARMLRELARWMEGSPGEAALVIEGQPRIAAGDLRRLADALDGPALEVVRLDGRRRSLELKGTEAEVGAAARRGVLYQRVALVVVFDG